MLDAMRAMGAPAEDIERVAQAIKQQRESAKQEPQAFGVHEDNWLIVRAFETLRTQWNFAGMEGERTGLNYAGVIAWLDMYVHRRKRRDVMGGLMVMEDSALRAFKEIRDEEKEG